MDPATLRTAAGNPVRGVAWPASAGMVPPLADAFTVRADSVPGIEAMLAPGAAVALVPGHEDAGPPDGWLQSCGKTQLASYLAGALWRSRGVDLLAWVNAGSRASVLSGYAAAAAQLGLDHGGGAEIGGRPVRGVAGRHGAAVAGSAGRPARRGGPGRPVASRSRRPAAGHRCGQRGSSQRAGGHGAGSPSSPSARRWGICSTG